MTQIFGVTIDLSHFHNFHLEYSFSANVDRRLFIIPAIIIPTYYIGKGIYWMVHAMLQSELLKRASGQDNRGGKISESEQSIFKTEEVSTGVGYNGITSVASGSEKHDTKADEIPSEGVQHSTKAQQVSASAVKHLSYEAKDVSESAQINAKVKDTFSGAQLLNDRCKEVSGSSETRGDDSIPVQTNYEDYDWKNFDWEREPIIYCRCAEGSPY
jgi:hypothetical protein